MKSFKDFADNSRNDIYLIAASIAAIAFTTFGEILIGSFASKSLRVLGSALLMYATFIFVCHIRDFCVTNPTFIVDEEHASYKQNIFACSGLCLILVILAIYSLYTIFQ